MVERIDKTFADLQFHHIKADGEPYALDNLQTLCIDHHMAAQG
jgi:hypothetical protein